MARDVLDGRGFERYVGTMSSRDIVLATLNARYTHASFGLRCLRANLGPLRERSVLVEGITKDLPLDFVTRLLAYDPKIVGLGVYIWNARPMLDVVRLLRQVAPEVVIVLGGPEVSHEVDAQEICSLAHHVVTQEGELAFAQLCAHYLAALAPGALAATKKASRLALVSDAPLTHVIEGGAPPIDDIVLAYDEYTDSDLDDRIIYVEASRGCPFRCAFCLSALDKKVRPVDEQKFFAALDRLYARGLRQFKFVDRTFNLDLKFAVRILHFFHEKLPPNIDDDGAQGLFLHFEMVPDRLPSELLDELARFPPGSIQLEVGLQTFNPDVAKILERRTDFDVACRNIEALRERTGVHIHADLIAGLPGEDWESFARGFDRLVASRPHEIQLGILKRLRGFPLATKAEANDLLFDSAPPYEILRTAHMRFEEMVHMRQIARVWDLAFNQGRFPNASALFLMTWNQTYGSVFTGVTALCDAVITRSGTTFGLSLFDLAHTVFVELVRLDVPLDVVQAAVESDYCEGGRRKRPPFLDPGWTPKATRAATVDVIPARQRRHVRELDV